MDTSITTYGPREARKLRGLTPKQVAAWAQISVDTVRKIERNWERARDGESREVATVEMAELIALALTRLAPSFPPVGVPLFHCFPPGSATSCRGRRPSTPRPVRCNGRAVSPKTKTPRLAVTGRGA